MNQVKGSCDGFMAIPRTYLGLEYYAVAFSPAKFRSQIGIVASADATKVVVTLPTNQGRIKMKTQIVIRIS